MTDKRETIQQYVKSLFTYLDVFCFVSGAFVIEENKDRKLYNLLSSAPDKYTLNLSKYKLITHDQYMTASSILMEIHMEDYPIVVTCKNNDDTPCEKTNTFLNIKWYSFEQSGRTFIYLKPETFPSTSISHLNEAISRYFLKKQNVSCIQPRREDCIKDKACKYTTSNSNDRPYRMFKTTIIDNKEYDNVESYFRQGDEAFIIEPVSTFIINEITKGETISVETQGNDKTQGNEIVKIYSSFELSIGGKQRTRRRKLYKKHKKSASKKSRQRSQKTLKKKGRKH